MRNERERRYAISVVVRLLRTDAENRRFRQRSRIAYNAPVFAGLIRLYRACSAAGGGGGPNVRCGHAWSLVKGDFQSPFGMVPAGSLSRIIGPALSGKLRSVKPGFSVMTAQSKIGYGNRRKIPLVGSLPLSTMLNPCSPNNIGEPLQLTN